MLLLLGNLLFSKPMARTTLISGLIDLCQLPYAFMTHQLFCHSTGPASALLLILPWTLLLARVSTIARVVDGHKLFYNTNPQLFLPFCYCSVSLTMAEWLLSPWFASFSQLCRICIESCNSVLGSVDTDPNKYWHAPSGQFVDELILVCMPAWIWETDFILK